MNKYNENIHNVNLEYIKPLYTPEKFMNMVPVKPEQIHTVFQSRKEIGDIINETSDKFLILVGPCSIHDVQACLEYANKLKTLSDQVSNKIMIVMRTYFEKPRTTTGWKGFINDPNLNDSFDVHEGLKKARGFLNQILHIGLPTATEFLDPFMPQYYGDLISWGAIGARTVESQTHRQLSSGLSMPIGFKNGTGGSVQIAIDAIIAAKNQHVFLGIDEKGQTSVVKTNGNNYGHLILRGGKTGPNYDSESVKSAVSSLVENELDPKLVIDCSHGNSNKDHRNQSKVFKSIIDQKTSGQNAIFGVMLESHLNPGSQSIPSNPEDLKYGVSVTDECIGWEETENLIKWAYNEL
ncbi:MAG: 3-deoxy-7-phosphoheptulonate synthase [Dehalococcoidia bacterium]